MSDREQSRLFVPMSEDIPDYRIKPLARLVYSNAFEFSIVGLILANAIVLAILTFDGVPAETANWLMGFDDIVIWVFVAELALRIISFGKRPWEFFKTGWNVFDFIVIAMIPVFSGATVVLRMLRLLRVVRLFRFMPDFRMLSTSLANSIRPLLSLVVLVGFIMFIYAMAGVYLFGEENPLEWGDFGAAMSTMVVLLTLENFPYYLEGGLASTGFAWIFFISFMFVVVFTVLNVLIGIVLSAMDEAREEMNNGSEGSSELVKKVSSAIKSGKFTEKDRSSLLKALHASGIEKSHE